MTADSFSKRRLEKADGRRLLLYARAPLPDAGLDAPSPRGSSDARPNAHLRWHPLLGEWVAYASHRQNRTFLPPREFNPLAPTVNPDAPTEVPAGPWDIAVFENLFPTLIASAHDPPQLDVATQPARGTCEVVVFTQDAAGALGRLPLWHVELLIDVWADRYVELGAHPDVQYVFAFENRGVEVGVTLQHPHGQIYAYPFIPPVAARELQHQRSALERTGRGLLEQFAEREVHDGVRLLYDGPLAVAFVPVCARYPYEVWVLPKRRAPSLAALTAEEKRDLARAMKTVLMKFDGLWNRPLPYIFAMHQAPTDGSPHEEAHVHAEFYPMMRMDGRLKHLAGSELGAGVFTADSLPEQKAAELRAVAVDVDA